MCSKIILKSLYLFIFWLNCQTVQAACTIAECEHEVFIDRAGFYIASVDIEYYVSVADAYQQPYFWGLSVLTSDGRNQGGFNSGLTLSNHLSFNGFIAFYLQQAEAVSITPYRYTGDADHFTLTLQQQNVNTGERVTVFEDNNAATDQALQTGVLSAGFYVLNVKANNADDEIYLDQSVGITIDAQHMTGGVHVGGWFTKGMSPLPARFAGFYIAQPQTIRLRTAFNEPVQAMEMEAPLIRLYHQTENGDLEAYSPASDNTLAVSSNVDEQLSNDASLSPAVSADGRYVAFASRASNLVAGDNNNAYDIFVKDVKTGEIERVSVDNDGQETQHYAVECFIDTPCTSVIYGTIFRPLDKIGLHSVCADSLYPAISGDGRYVSFISAARFDNDDENNTADLFLHDRETGKTQRISLNLQQEGRRLDAQTLKASYPDYTLDNCSHSNFQYARTPNYIEQLPTVLNNYYQAAAMSYDGQWIAFNTDAALLPEDSNEAYDVYLYHRDTDSVQRVSVDSQGAQTEGGLISCTDYHSEEECASQTEGFITITPDSYSQSISQDGRYIAFASQAIDLVSDDSNLVEDVFVHDRETGETRRVSVNSSGQQAARYFLPCMHSVGCDEYTAPDIRGQSNQPAISADGRYISFTSTATNLVADYNSINRQDVYVHDRVTGVTEVVSVDSNGQLSDTQGQTQPMTSSFDSIMRIGSHSAKISADGRYVVFLSTENALDVNEQTIVNNEQSFLFLRDREQGTTQRLKPFTGLDSMAEVDMLVLSSDAQLMSFRAMSYGTTGDVSNSQVYVMMLQ